MEYKVLRKEDLVETYIRKVLLLGIVDGDTIDVYIKQGFRQGFEERIRLNRVDTPERRGTESSAGKWVTDKVTEWLEAENELWLHSISFNLDRYGRCVGDIYRMDGECLNQWLLTNAYGWPTDEDGKIIGNRDITRLKLPTGIVNQVLLSQRT